MNEILLRKIAQYVRCTGKPPKEIKGYNDEEVGMTVQDMFDNKVIYYGKVTKCSPADGNYVIEKGRPVPINGTETVEMTMLSESEFEKIYGITWY